MFFNRWFRAIIYFISDRSKLVPVEDYEKCKNDINTLQRSYDSLQDLYSNSKLKIDNLEEDLSIADENYKELEKQSINHEAESKAYKNALKGINEKMDKLSILNATYGYKHRTIDVTETVSKLISNHNIINVNNNTFGEDPWPWMVKNLIINYTFKAEYKSLIVSEDTQVMLENGELKTNLTPSTTNKLDTIRYKQWFIDTFNGKYIRENYQLNEMETVYIDRSGFIRFVSGKIYRIHISAQNNQTLILVFINSKDEKAGQESLEYKNKDELFGKDMTGNDITYSRVKE